MASSTTSRAGIDTKSEPGAQQKRGLGQVIRSYFYWTYKRGSFHYDVMVTLILLFIFITPQLWDYGATPTFVTTPTHPLQVVPNGRGVIITVQAPDVSVATGATYSLTKKALRKAIEPVTGDDVFIQHWETTIDPQGNLVWRVWAHR